jgi:hypothetical protein
MLGYESSGFWWAVGLVAFWYWRSIYWKGIARSERKGRHVDALKRRKEDLDRGPGQFVTLEDLRKVVAIVTDMAHYGAQPSFWQEQDFQMYPVLRPMRNEPNWEIIFFDKKTGAEMDAIGFGADLMNFDEIFRWLLIMSCRKTPMPTIDGKFILDLPARNDDSVT